MTLKFRLRRPLGVGMGPTPELLKIVREMKRNAERYEKIRRMTPAEFEEIFHWNIIKAIESLDNLVDRYQLRDVKQENP
jgi:hypothetical protein